MTFVIWQKKINNGFFLFILLAVVTFILNDTIYAPARPPFINIHLLFVCRFSRYNGGRIRVAVIVRIGVPVIMRRRLSSILNLRREATLPTSFAGLTETVTIVFPDCISASFSAKIQISAVTTHNSLLHNAPSILVPLQWA